MPETIDEAPKAINPLETRAWTDIHSSASSYSSYLSAGLLLREQIKGIRIIDIGAGASDFTEEVLQRGADAYAIDPRYTSLDNLESDIMNFSLNKDQNPNLSRLTDDALRQLVEQSSETLEKFKVGFSENPTRYLPKSATELPFSDSFADLIVSNNCLTQLARNQYHLYIKAVRECIRVLKTNGKLRTDGNLPIEPDFIAKVRTDLSNYAKFDLLGVDTPVIEITKLSNTAAVQRKSNILRQLLRKTS